MKKGSTFPDEEFSETIWEFTPNGGDFTIIGYYDKYLRRCHREEAEVFVTAEFRKDGTLVNREVSDFPKLDEHERRKAQLLHAEDFAKENNWTIKDYAYDDRNLYVRYSDPNRLDYVIVQISVFLTEKKVITDSLEINRIMKIIRAKRNKFV